MFNDAMLLIYFPVQRGNVKINILLLEQKSAIQTLQGEWIDFRRSATDFLTEKYLNRTMFLNVKKLSEKEIESMINKGEFQQAMHIAAWLMTKRL